MNYQAFKSRAFIRDLMQKSEENVEKQTEIPLKKKLKAPPEKLPSKEIIKKEILVKTPSKKKTVQVQPKITKSPLKNKVKSKVRKVRK